MPSYRRTFSGDTEDMTFSSRPYSASYSLGLIQPLKGVQGACDLEPPIEPMTYT